jgi:superfamily II DNA or RNA helicase
VDEAHHVGARVFRDVIARVGAPMLGGATATPWRGDRYDIDEVLGEPVVRIGIAEGMQRGFLCEVDYRMLADDIDWALVRCHSAHGYSLRDLNTRLLVPIRDAEAARTLAQVFEQERRRGLVVFCPSVAHAHVFAATLRLFGFDAGAITSTMPMAARQRVMAQFRKGRLNAVTTVDIFNEGIDVPDVDMLAFMRVTHSRRIFVQQMGRGLRVAPGKNDVIVMDFVSDLRRLADVIGLQRAVAGKLECLAEFERLVQFREKGTSKFMFRWLLDQADLFSRNTDSELVEPAFDFPEPLFQNIEQ